MEGGEHTKCKTSKQKEMTKIRVKVNETETIESQ
jgi:hypothetical protein